MKIDELLNKIVKLACLCQQESGLKETGRPFLYYTLTFLFYGIHWHTFTAKCKSSYIQVLY